MPVTRQTTGLTSRLFTESPDPTNLTDVVLLQHLAELLAFFVSQHSTRAQFFVLSHPISAKVATLLYLKQKTLRHGEARLS